MAEQDAPEFLKDALKFGINLGLERITRLMELMGDPQNSFKSVHIAGTNGKGSVSAFTSTILALSGLKTGVFTSPYIERFSERIRIIDGEEGLKKYLEDETYGEIDKDDLERISSKVESFAKQMVSEGYESPTEFELITAICFQYFKEQEVDVAVLEVGLGGRLDSTNVISSPLCTAITAIGLDHMDRLGDTIALITAEKAGIIKPSCPVVLLDPEITLLSSKDDVLSVVSETAASNGSELIIAGDKDTIRSCSFDAGKMSFEYKGVRYETSLLGRHQSGNAAVAVEICSVIGIPQSYISRGISLTRWKCRAEAVMTDPFVILDGGHNPQGARTLADLIFEMYGNKGIRLVMGVMADKDVEGILVSYKEGGMNIEEAFCVLPDNPRALTPALLSKIINNVYNHKVKTHEADDPVEGVRQALALSIEDKKPLVITGSLYLLGKIRTYLKGRSDARLSESCNDDTADR